MIVESQHRATQPQASLWEWTGPAEQETSFARFDAANPVVWRLFERFTFDRIARGCAHYSARGVFHRIRWETVADADDGSGFKLNNNWSPYYARKFHRAHPEHGGFFRIRRARADQSEQGEA